MSWEQSLTITYIGGALVLAYIGSCFKQDEENISWTRFVPIGLRTLFYFFSIGLLMFGFSAQVPIMMENGIYVNETYGNSTYLLSENITSGISIITIMFYTLMIIIGLLTMVIIIQNILLKKKEKKNGKESGRDYERY